MRARRAAALLPVDGQAPLPEDERLLPIVQETIAALNLGPEHGGAVQLARRYAKVMDEAKDPAWAARWLGPLLLAALSELGATPASRAALTKGVKPEPQGPSRLDQLRAVRRTY